MPAMFETIVVHDAPEEELGRLVEAVASELRAKGRWRHAVGRLPNSTGLRVPMSVRSWGERLSIAVEEKSIRIRSESRFPWMFLDFGKHADNADLVRRIFHRMIQAGEAAPH